MNEPKTEVRVLILSATERFAEFLMPLLQARGLFSVASANDLRTAKSITEQENFDLIFLNSPLADGDGYRFALELSRTPGAVVLAAVSAERHEEAAKILSSHGVYLLSKPLSSKALSAALDWMLATRARLFEIEESRHSLEEKMKDLTLINRAKWLLIDRLGMSEAEAHYHIEKQAMDRRISKREVAEEIVKIYG